MHLCELFDLLLNVDPLTKSCKVTSLCHIVLLQIYSVRSSTCSSFIDIGLGLYFLRKTFAKRRKFPHLHCKLIRRRRRRDFFNQTVVLCIDWKPLFNRLHFHSLAPTGLRWTALEKFWSVRHISATVTLCSFVLRYTLVNRSTKILETERGRWMDRPNHPTGLYLSSSADLEAARFQIPRMATMALAVAFQRLEKTARQPIFSCSKENRIRHENSSTTEQSVCSLFSRTFSVYVCPS